MKNRIPSFLAGALTTCIIGGLGLTALAAAGTLTITVDPINIEVNGETFQPQDVNGKDVMVFAYQGTTYAPLRALAEAYDLEVGYDSEKNLATVVKPESTTPNPGNTTGTATATTRPKPETPGEADVEALPSPEELSYEQFKGMWSFEVIASDLDDLPLGQLYYVGNSDLEPLCEYLNKMPLDTLKKYTFALCKEYSQGDEYGGFYVSYNSISSELYHNTIMELVLAGNSGYKHDTLFYIRPVTTP